MEIHGDSARIDIDAEGLADSHMLSVLLLRPLEGDAHTRRDLQATALRTLRTRT